MERSVEKVWDVKRVVALVCSIGAPLAALIGAIVGNEMGDHVEACAVGIPVAMVAYLLIGGFPALIYAIKRAFGIFIRHLSIPFSLFGIVLMVFLLMVGAVVGLIYFVILPIILFFTYDSTKDEDESSDAEVFAAEEA